MGIEPTPFVPAKRYLMEIAFDGGNYSGWQIQPHCLAVQQVIQEHLTKMYDKQPIHLIGSSRTDATHNGRQTGNLPPDSTRKYTPCRMYHNGHERITALP